MSLIKLSEIGFRYNQQWVLKNISLEVKRGEFLGILGPNGSGKTTLLKIIDGILKPEEGEVQIDGIPESRIKRNHLAKTIAVVAQDIQMTFPFTVLEIVLMGRSPHLGKWQFEGETDFKIARDAMKLTDTQSLSERSMFSLSGGERQRVMIARALAQEPQILLLDESTAFLDIKHQIDFFDLIKSLNERTHLTVVAVTHDINLAARYCDRLILMRNGEIHCLGSPDEVIQEKNIKEVYDTDVSVDQSPMTGRPRITILGSRFPKKDI